MRALWRSQNPESCLSHDERPRRRARGIFASLWNIGEILLRGLTTHDFCGWWKAWSRGLWRRFGRGGVERCGLRAFSLLACRGTRGFALCARSANTNGPNGSEGSGFGAVLHFCRGQAHCPGGCVEEHFAISSRPVVFGPDAQCMPHADDGSSAATLRRRRTRERR